MSWMRHAVGFLLASSLMGCAAMSRQWVQPLGVVGDHPQPCRSDKACIYVFRSGYYGLPYHLIVKDNAKKVGETGPDSYLSWDRDPGEFVLSSVGEDEFMISVSVEAGKNYYWLQDAEMGTFSFRSSLFKLTEDKALKYFKRCKSARFYK